MYDNMGYCNLNENQGSEPAEPSIEIREKEEQCH